MKIFISLCAVVLTITMVVYSCGGSGTTTGSGTGSDDPKEAVVSGAQLYMDNCVICHGQDGKAGMSGATDLSVSVLSHANTVDVITNGRNAMRAFSNQFSKEEIELIAKHVESLRK
jgi:cytochrome c6